MLLTVVILCWYRFLMFYDANIGERCETMRTWFDRGVNRLHRLHRLFSCQRKLFLPTENTKNTKFFSQQITLITQKIKFVLFVLSVGKRKKIIRVICVIRWQNKTSWYSCHPLAKQKISVIRVICWQKQKNSCSSCYPLAKQKISVICVIRWQNKTSWYSCHPLAKKKSV